MGIFKDQSLLTIELETNYDISAATEAKILYTKPDGTNGEFVGGVSSTTKVSYTVEAGDLDQAGTWIMQAYVLIGGKIGYGGKVYVSVEPNLD
jgi:hypothetical protein